MASSEWCTDKLSKLLKEELRISALNEIKDHLSSVSYDEANQTANLLELPLVFDCLNDTNSEQVDLACEVLSLCMGNLSLGESTNRYNVPLERALNHPFPNVKIMALKELERYTLNANLMINLCQPMTLLKMIIKCIADDDLSVANKAANIVTILGQSDGCIKYVVAPEAVKTFEEVMATNELVRLRVYEALINIGKLSEAKLKLVVSSGLLEHMFKELNNKDLLLMMNMIQLLTSLAVTSHGYRYLDNKGVLELFLKNIDPLFIVICEGGILKFFGHLAHWKPSEMLSNYKAITDRLFVNLEMEDLTIVGITLDTIAHIGETNEGKLALDATGKMSDGLLVVKNRLVALPTPLLVRALNCIETLLHVDNVNGAVGTVTKRWFDALGEDPMAFVSKYAKNPFSEIRLAGLGIVNAITLQHWGHEYITNTPGFVEFLVDRSAESIKDCKQAKYDIIKNLAHSSVFNHTTQLRLQAYVKEGPYFVLAVTEVAVEGDD